MNQLAERLVPMFYIAAIDNRADACDDAAGPARAKGSHIEVRRKQAAVRQQIDLVLNVGRPPCVALAVNLEWQARELVELLAARWPLDADSVACDFGVCRHELNRAARSTFLIAADRPKIIRE